MTIIKSFRSLISAFLVLLSVGLAAAGCRTPTASQVKDDDPSAAAAPTSADLIGKLYQGLLGTERVSIQVKSQSQVLWSRGTSIYTYRIDGSTLTIEQMLPTGRIIDVQAAQIAPDLKSLTLVLDQQTLQLTTDPLPDDAGVPFDPIAAMAVKGRSYDGTIGSAAVSITFNADGTAVLTVDSKRKKAKYSQTVNSVEVSAASVLGVYKHYRTFSVGEDGANLFGSEDGTDADLRLAAAADAGAAP